MPTQGAKLRTTIRIALAAPLAVAAVVVGPTQGTAAAQCNVGNNGMEMGLNGYCNRAGGTDGSCANNMVRKDGKCFPGGNGVMGGGNLVIPDVTGGDWGDPFS